MFERIVLPILVVIGVTAPPAAAQCVPFGPPCPGGEVLCCVTPPKTGSVWRVGGCPSCNGRNHVLLFGACDPVGVSIPAPPACPFCAGCTLNVKPQGFIPWSLATGLAIPIPPNPALVGVSFCIQDLCLVDGLPCGCLSNALAVKIQAPPC